MTGAAASAAESIEWTGPGAMAELLTDNARSWLATIPHAALETGDGDNARDILGQSDFDDTIAIKNPSEGLVTTTGDRMDLTEGREETFDHVIRNLGRAVAKMDEATLGVNAHHTERDVTVTEAGRHDAITIDRSLESDAESTIPQELHGGDGVLVEGLQQLRQDSGRTNRLIDGWREKRHQTTPTVDLHRHDWKKLSRMGDQRLNLTARWATGEQETRR